MLRMLWAAGVVLVAAAVADAAAADDRMDCRTSNDMGIAACTRVIEGNDWSRKDRFDAFMNRGQTHYELNQLKAAIRDFGQAISLFPRYPMPYVNRGNCWFRERDYDSAIADYNEALLLDRTFTAAHTGRGLAYEGKGDTAKAIENYRAALAAPVRNDDGPWAHSTARARLKVLGAD